MSHEHCHEGSCSSGAHHHHHDHSCCCGEGCCCQKHQEKDFAAELLDLADEAWMEVLKEKIKEQIIKNNGDHLDALAKLVSETNNARWKNKIGKKNSCHEFKAKLDDLFK